LRKHRIKIVIYIFILVLSNLLPYIAKSRADLLEVYAKGTGNFLPMENCSLIMTNASIIFNIEYLTNRIDISFEGNYTVYNPDESLNMTLVAPFSTDFYNLESTCIVKVGGNVTSFSFLEYNFFESPWEQYLDTRFEMSSRRKFIVINTTVAENSSIELEYSFEAYTVDPNSVDVLEIYYDVGTSRAWNGSITERVEFKAHGKLPDSYSDYEGANCTITSIENGKSYVWEWLNEVITANRVYIKYRNPGRYFLGRILPFIIIPSVFSAIIIPAVIINRRAKRKGRT